MLFRSGADVDGGGDGVTGATVDAAGAVSGSNVDGGGDGVTGATVAVGGTAKAAGAAELGGSRGRSRIGPLRFLVGSPKRLIRPGLVWFR